MRKRSPIIPDSSGQAFASATKYLSSRIRSTKEIFDFLLKKGFNEKTITQTVNRLEELKFLDDFEFGRMWIESRQIYKGKSKLILKKELQLKGLDNELIGKLLNDAKDDLQTAKKLFDKKKEHLKHLSKDEFFKKMAGFLQRKGFSYDIIKKVITSSPS